MAHWNSPPEREDGDTHDETADDVVRARQWLRRKVSENVIRNPLYGALADIERAAAPYYLGMDYDEDRDDVDEMGPY